VLRPACVYQEGTILFGTAPGELAADKESGLELTYAINSLFQRRTTPSYDIDARRICACNPDLLRVITQRRAVCKRIHSDRQHAGGRESAAQVSDPILYKTSVRVGGTGAAYSRGVEIAAGEYPERRNAGGHVLSELVRYATQ
jgi:hypothetical protein